MNNGNRANDTNDNGDELHVNFPETERQELLRRRLKFERGRQLLLQERAQLLLEQQQQQLLLEQARLLREQHHLFQDDVEARMVRAREGNSYLNDNLSRLMFSCGSNNNKPNWWKRIRKKMQIQFLCPWSNQILNSTILANNNKRFESVCVMGD